MNLQKHSAMKKIIEASQRVSKGLGFRPQSAHVFDPRVGFNILSLLDIGLRKNIFPELLRLGGDEFGKVFLRLVLFLL